MPGPQQTRQLGSAIRIYRNAGNETLAIDDISITCNILRLTTDVWHYSPFVATHRLNLHLGSLDRIIDNIQMIGDYMSISTDLSTAQWPTSETVSGVDVSFSALSQIGDTI
jgi:hypothetical protein